MFRNTITRFKFLLKSQNQHGLHSPFVYDFVTKGLYKKELKSNNFEEYSELESLSKKQVKLLSKIVKYFKVDTIYFDIIKFNKTKENGFKTLFINDISKLSKLDFSKLNTEDIIVIKSIYQNKKKYLQWLEITKNKDITVSVNLYYFGLIFNRKEQAKEHFIIRT